MNDLSLLFAYLLDQIIGDSSMITHPVILIGRFISKLEDIFYNQQKSNGCKLLVGGVLVCLVLGTTYAFTWLIVYFFTLIHPLLGCLINVWLISTTIAVKGLKDAGLKIKGLLQENNLAKARKEVGYIVGRDTNNMDEKEITRATVETIAENIVDAITSPLFYAFLGGAPLAMTYRAVNTLDSMLGYKNEKYLYFGRVAARVDDIFNYIPARLTGFSIALISFFLPGLSGKNSFEILFRDARQHPSPNSGYSESAVSGALMVRLGGLNYYHGRLSQRPFIGNDIYPLSTDKIDKTNKIMFATATFWVIIFTILNLLFISKR